MLWCPVLPEATTNCGFNRSSKEKERFQKLPFSWDPFFTLSFSSTPPYISLLSWQAILEFPVMLQSSFRDGGCVGGLVNISQVGKLPVRPECALCVTHMEERQEKVEVYFHVNSSSQGTSGVGHRKDKVRWSRHHFYILTAETFSFSLY